MCEVLKVYELYLKAWWLSWLERRPVTAEVVGSNPIRVVCEKSHNLILPIWNLSSAGRASALQAEGHRFEPCRFHFRGISAYMQETVNASNRYQWKLVDNEYADMAQLAEQLICNQQVEGSSPPIGFMDH